MLLYIASFVLLWIGEAAEIKCNGTSQDPHGLIQSPNYPNQFPNDSSCTWHLKQEKGKWMAFYVDDLDILNLNHRCDKAYLQIKDYPRMCERNKPTEPLATNQEATINFVGTDASGRGFSLHYETFSCTEILDARTGELASPNYPNPYPHDLECSWRLKTTSDMRVKVDFIGVNMNYEDNCQGDSLKLIDVRGGRQYLSGVYCGKMSPPVAYSRSYELMVNFTTNFDGAQSGFKFLYSTVPWSALPVVTPYPDPCNIKITAAAGTIRTPNYPQNPLTDRTCEWTIERPIDEWIQFRFLDFDLFRGEDEQPSSDELTLRDGTEIIYSYPKDSKPLSTLATKNKAVITFKATAEKPRRGFLLRYMTSTCNKKINGGSGEISSPNYPNKYPLNVECTWKIIAPPQRKVYVQFFEVNIEESIDCSIDVVTLFDVAAGKNYTFCGHMKPAPTVSTGNELWIQFSSKTTNPKRGFAFKYDTKWFPRA